MTAMSLASLSLRRLRRILPDPAPRWRQHAGEDRVNWLKKQLATPHIEKIMHNAMYDLGWLRWAGIEVQGKIIDTMVAAPLLNENRRWYNLNSLAGEYLGEWKNEKMLKAAASMYGVDPKGEMWKLHASFVGKYAEQDAAVTLRLWDRLRADIDKDEVNSIFELETSLIPLMLDMKTRVCVSMSIRHTMCRRN